MASGPECFAVIDVPGGSNRGGDDFWDIINFNGGDDGNGGCPPTTIAPVASGLDPNACAADVAGELEYGSLENDGVRRRVGAVLPAGSIALLEQGRDIAIRCKRKDGGIECGVEISIVYKDSWQGRSLEVVDSSQLANCQQPSE